MFDLVHANVTQEEETSLSVVGICETANEATAANALVGAQHDF